MRQRVVNTITEADRKMVEKFRRVEQFINEAGLGKNLAVVVNGEVINTEFSKTRGSKKMKVRPSKNFK